MNKLHQAYIDLGLSPGAPLDDVLERWRTVARMWHPDRAATPAEKAIAETELKKINGARDLLVKHFQTGEHRLQHCDCELPQPAYSYTPPPPPPPKAEEPKEGATSPPPAAKTAAGSATRTRTRRPETSASPGIMWLVTAMMILLGWGFVHMNSKIIIQQKSEMSGYQQMYMPVATRSVEPVFNLRSSSKTQNTEGEANKQEKARETESTATPSAPPPVKPKKPSITFVSSDGRLISLDDGTAWELYSSEAADSFFHWEPGDRITVKGANSMPLWLVNESRAYQAVKVLPVR